MRVLHAYKVFRPDIDGGIVSVIALACSRRSADITSSILFARGRFGLGRTYDFDLVKGRAVASLGTFLGMPIAPGFPLALFSALRHVDVVALHLPFPLNDIGAIGIPDRVGLVVHWHSEIHGRELLARALDPFVRRTLARADRIIVSNKEIVDNSSLLRPHRAKCEIVPFGVDFKKWDPTLANEVQRARVDELRRRHPRLIAALARLVPYKGFDVLLRALTQVDAHLVIIGTGAERKSLEKLAIQLGVSDRVTFTGYLSNDDVKVHLWSAKVFAFPSTTDAETFGISQLEAMAVGLPIVNTRLNTAVPWVARDGIEAVTVPPGDPQALAAALSRLLDDKVMANKFGVAGQARVREEFNDTWFVDRVQAIYREVHEAARVRQR
jgi:glycosyltransferase involved in cell wall biosynthesis